MRTLSALATVVMAVLAIALCSPALIANTGLVPEFNEAHEYRFVMDLDTYDGPLTLGNGDGGVSDNFGEYRVEIYEVEFR